ncbi:(4Fe-4S)-binding protein [Chryseobacterium gleum]|uniref:(4Fe-4S)-binding protein n=1 Tax=Chryseobacterium gleum TaxID=250 RepID=UPI0028B15031|nr:(4Fe-4S)-binding protein [Chryseobacterium gleum]
MKTHEYSNEDITIIWQSEKCIHAAICVKMLPKVYNPSDRPWVKIENASTEELKKQIDQCPTKALSYKLNSTI